MRKWILALSATAILAGCAAEPVWAPDEAVTKSSYRHNGPARLTLFTMISNDTGSGAHSSLMINGSQRVVFDPAGSFKHPSLPERNDVVYGVTPQVADVYTRYHARETYHVLVQEIDVSPQVAEQALGIVMNYGAVQKSYCTQSTSDVLSRLPGFESIKRTWFPKALANDVAKIPGVRSRELYEYDSDDNSKVLGQWVPPAK